MGLSRHIKSIVGDINNYSEIGCPLWGSLNIMNKQKKVQFYNRQTFSILGSTVQKENLTYIIYLTKK